MFAFPLAAIIFSTMKYSPAGSLLFRKSPSEAVITLLDVHHWVHNSLTLQVKRTPQKAYLWEALVQFQLWITSHFFFQTPFLLEKRTDRQATVIQTWILGQLSKRWIKWACYFKENKWEYFLPMLNLNFQEKIRIFGKLESTHLEPDIFPIYTHFL